MISVRSGSAVPAMALAALLVAMATDAMAASHDIASCSVTGIEGAPVRVRVADQWSVLELGALPQGAEAITTGPGARAKIECEPDLVLTVGSGTEVSLDDLLAERAASEPVLLRLLRGIIGIDAPTSGWGGFEVETPLAIASSRSTTWLVEYAPLTGSAVFVRSGSVEVISTQRQPLAVLEEGQGVTIGPNMARQLSAEPPVIVVVEWGPARLDPASASLGFDWQ